MATPEETKIIDAWFAFFGSMGFDIGAVIGNLPLAFFAQDGHESARGARGEHRAWLLKTVQDVRREFVVRFLSLWRAQPSVVAIPIYYFYDEHSMIGAHT